MNSPAKSNVDTPETEEQINGKSDANGQDNSTIEGNNEVTQSVPPQENSKSGRNLRSRKNLKPSPSTSNAGTIKDELPKQKRQPRKTTKRKTEEIDDLETKTLLLSNDETTCDSTVLESKDSVDELEDNISKKTKTENYDKKNVQKPRISRPRFNNVQQKCEHCRQRLSSVDLKIYPGHPNGAVEEFIALTDPKLSLFTGQEDTIEARDEMPQNKLTHFSVYDKNGHLCYFDTGLVEKNVVLYFSGYMKPIYEEDPSAEGGVPTKDMGPINEWWTSGYDGGELAILGFTTGFGEYILMEPSEAYAPFMVSVKEKIYMSKIVIEFLLDEDNPSYEDLLNRLQTLVPPKGLSRFTEDSLLRHAQFICEQVISFDASAGPEDLLLITTACMRTLVTLAGVTLNKRMQLRKPEAGYQKSKKVLWTKATTTKLVNDMFETFFSDQMAECNEDEVLKFKRQRCGVCEICLQQDCGQCSACKNMVKFGGSGRSKQACIRRRCPNMAIQEANDSDQDEDDMNDVVMSDTKITQKMILKEFKHVDKEITWMGEPILNDGRRTFYNSVMLVDEEIRANDYVLIESNDPTVPLQVAKVMYMWEDKNGAKLCHANWFRRGSDTVLGDTSDPFELFLLDECDNVPFASIKSKAQVIYKKSPDNWHELGNTDELPVNGTENKDSQTFFYQKKYTPETARFEDPPLDPECLHKEINHRFCPACVRFTDLQCYYTPRVFERQEEKSSEEVTYGMVKFKGEEFRVGSAVYLMPSAIKYTYTSTYHLAPKVKRGTVDEDMYPEYYRKSSDFVKGSNHDTSEPYHIGYINSIYAKTNNQLVASSDIWIRINMMYRPENTHKGLTLMQQLDLNIVYWSDKVRDVKFADVAGKCYLVYSDNLTQSVEEWTAAGPHRFYFTQAYNESQKTFVDPPYHATNIGKSEIGKGNGKAKCKSKRSETDDKKAMVDKPIDYCTVSRKLRTLDVFAGCGGLSEGLKRAGIADNRWAIEKDEMAACAYRLNNPDTTVFFEDCNVLLRKVLKGDTCDKNGQRLPQKRDVELLCGGPPCQGFSGMNRFNWRQYSLFKNSLIVSCLSYCDYYRPKFFIMENVRNFATFKRGMVLKLTLRCLVRMGYQCTFGILQAGNYGVPQTRRRLILLAAAPGEVLPKYPEPTHVFNKRAGLLSIMIDDKQYSSNCDWTESAPYRTINVRDAMSDLPTIRNGWNQEEMSYGEEPISHFQRQIRPKEPHTLLRDHICKDMAPLVEARIAHIPTASGSDWRDLPNIAIRLSDGTLSKKLEYMHHDKKAGVSSTGALRGVCCCCTGKPCDPMDKQYNTLIPWCLPHTGRRHNHWAGLYGRLEWDGYFGTTITNPEPMGKQGRVLHPEQTRVVSVRECARSQGFPDSFRFYGNVLEKHRQIGNAVPPPLATALGLEIRKCLKTDATG